MGRRFFSVYVWSKYGVLKYQVMFFVHLSTGEVFIAGASHHADSAWMLSMIRNWTDAESPFGSDAKFLIRDCDRRYTKEVDWYFTAIGLQPRSVNSLPKDQWFSLYGLVWKKAIEAGTKAVMCGHISFPDYQGMQENPDEALPATFSKKLMVDLLRKELGFQGVIVSDANCMVGFTCRYPANELAWRNVEAGSDSVLFSDPVKDFDNLMNALRTGKLHEERVEESARRILELKASLNLQEDCFAPEPEADEFQASQDFAQNVSERSLTVLRPCKLHQLPISPAKQKKILTVSLVRNDNLQDFTELEIVDQELRARGFEVDHMTNPEHSVLFEAIQKYDRIFVNLTVQNHATMPLRLAGKPMMVFWRGFFAQAPEKVVYTSFGSPYVLYDHPYFENCLCTWGCLPVCQKSAVKYWCGEIEANGIMPVREQKIQIKRLNL